MPDDARRWRLCLVTDRAATRVRALPEVVGACAAAGLPLVQVRDKAAGGRDLLELAQAVRRVTAPAGTRLVVNDRVDVAVAVEADGVHLPAGGIPPRDARMLLAPGRLVGVSTHSPAEAAAAAQAGADYVVFGPVYDTPSKREYGRPQGLPALAETCRRAPVPVLAIGGVTLERVGELRAAGAAGVAVIRALLEAEDPARATRALLAAWGA
jgi:thiamine-phosphate pyrophosphorylase